ncbi:MAG: DUF433 domain-containing protein, partial [Acidobacteria bacterium]|nr:DUF433 domain-containing protein [Acidobacteriota bacterium]
VARLFPWRRSLEEPKLMVIDPEVSYGRPVLVGTRIPSATLFQRNQAGDDIAELAQDFQLEERRVQEAIQWEAEAREEAKAA